MVILRQVSTSTCHPPTERVYSQHYTYLHGIEHEKHGVKQCVIRPSRESHNRYVQSRVDDFSGIPVESAQHTKSSKSLWTETSKQHHGLTVGLWKLQNIYWPVFLWWDAFPRHDPWNTPLSWRAQGRHLQYPGCREEGVLSHGTCRNTSILSPAYHTAATHSYLTM